MHNFLPALALHRLVYLNQYVNVLTLWFDGIKGQWRQWAFKHCLNKNKSVNERINKGVLYRKDTWRYIKQYNQVKQYRSTSEIELLPECLDNCIWYELWNLSIILFFFNKYYLIWYVVFFLLLNWSWQLCILALQDPLQILNTCYLRKNSGGHSWKSDRPIRLHLPPLANDRRHIVVKFV